MARKERNNIDYFPHSVTHGKKMFYLRQKYQNNGYSVWFMLLEELGKSNYHYLDLSDDIQKMYLSSEFMVSEILLNEIITDLVKLGEFDVELWNNESILYNEKFVDNIKDAYKKRNNECIDKNSLVSLLLSKSRIKPSKSNPIDDKSTLKGVGNTQTKLKDSKLKDNIYTFEIFWDKYHTITTRKKEDKEPALKKWKKLTLKEHEKAIINIPFYFENLNDKKYCKKARTYLGDKNFNDEFEKKKPLETKDFMKGKFTYKNDLKNKDE